MAFLTWGILEDPPTRMTSSMSAMVNSLEASTRSMISMVVWMSPAEAASNSSLVMVKTTFWPPTVRVPLVDSAVDSLFLMVSESLTRVCLTSSSSSMDSTSMPVSSATFSLMSLEMAASQSFPPRSLSPSVATAVKDLPSISRMVTSKVPPPRS